MKVSGGLSVGSGISWRRRMGRDSSLKFFIMGIQRRERVLLLRLSRKFLIRRNGILILWKLIGSRMVGNSRQLSGGLMRRIIRLLRGVIWGTLMIGLPFALLCAF